MPKNQYPDTAELEKLLEDAEWRYKYVDGGLDLAATGFVSGRHNPKTTILIDYENVESRVLAQTFAKIFDGIPTIAGEPTIVLDSLSQITKGYSRLGIAMEEGALAVHEALKGAEPTKPPYPELIEHPHLRHNPVTKGKGRPAHIDPHRRGKIR